MRVSYTSLSWFFWLLTVVLVCNLFDYFSLLHGCLRNTEISKWKKNWYFMTWIKQLFHNYQLCHNWNVIEHPTMKNKFLTQKLLKQSYVAPRLKSSLQKLYDRHHDLIDLRNIHILYNNGSFTFYVDVFFHLSCLFMFVVTPYKIKKVNNQDTRKACQTLS